MESSKRELKYPLVSRSKLEEEEVTFMHSTEVSKLSLEIQKFELVIQTCDNKIKIKSLILLNAFNERGFT